MSQNDTTGSARAIKHPILKIFKDTQRTNYPIDMPNCHVQKETSFQNQRKTCRQCLICKVYLNLKGLAPNRTYINFIDNLCAICFSRAIYNFSPKFAHKLPRKLSPNTKSRRLLPVSCWIWSFFWVKSSRVGSRAVGFPRWDFHPVGSR